MLGPLPPRFMDVLISIGRNEALCRRTCDCPGGIWGRWMRLGSAFNRSGDQ